MQLQAAAEGESTELAILSYLFSKMESEQRYFSLENAEISHYRQISLS